MEDVDRAARRPQNTCLDVSAVESRLGETMPTLSADLDALEPWLGL
jgi:dTDP-4-dehydrorhamnose reductase